MTLVNKVTIDEAVCKGCALCTATCPKKLLVLDASRLNAKAYHPAIMTAQENCLACAMCAIICPDSAITVEKGV
ncbi:MAG: 4Fe-4S dicluster domain-containing protein [Clostridiales bacterium]|nr:4Fe-4S dicluster domain-containing protein [Clostridiales bacterium]